MPVAARDIPFYDFAQKKQVVVKKGSELPAEQMIANRCDLAKLVRTGYIETEPVGAVKPVPHRGRRPREEG